MTDYLYMLFELAAAEFSRENLSVEGSFSGEIESLRRRLETQAVTAHAPTQRSESAKNVEYPLAAALAPSTPPAAAMLQRLSRAASSLSPSENTSSSFPAALPSPGLYTHFPAAPAPYSALPLSGTHQTVSATSPVLPSAAEGREEPAEAERLSRIFERDARRYRGNR